MDWTVLGFVIVVWICFLLGSIVNFQAWRIALKAGKDDYIPSGFRFIPGIAGSVAVLMTLPQLAVYWAALPLFLDVYCLGGFVLALFGFVRKEEV